MVWPCLGKTGPKGNSWTCQSCGGWSFADKSQCHHCFLPRPAGWNGAKTVGKGKGKGKGQSVAERQLASAASEAKKLKNAAKKQQQKAMKATKADAAMAKELEEAKAEINPLKRQATSGDGSQTSSLAEETIKALQLALPDSPVVEDQYIFKKTGITPLKEPQPLAAWTQFPSSMLNMKTPEEEVEETCKATDNVKSLQLAAATAKQDFENAKQMKSSEKTLRLLEKEWKEQEELLSTAQKKDGSGKCLASLRNAEVDLACEESDRVADFLVKQKKARERAQSNIAAMNVQIQAIIARRVMYAKVAEEADKAHEEKKRQLVERSELRLKALKARMPAGQAPRLGQRQFQ